MSAFSSLEQAFENAVAAEVEERVATLTMVGQRNPRVLTLPEGDGEFTLSEVLAHNGISLDLNNMTTVVVNDGKSTAINGDSAITAGSRIVASATEPNGL